MRDQDKKRFLAEIFEDDDMDEIFKEDPEPEEPIKPTKYVLNGEDEDPEEDKWD